MSREIILARRARFVAAALAALGATACSGSDSEPQACLSPVGDSGALSDAATGGSGGVLSDAATGGSGGAVSDSSVDDAETSTDANSSDGSQDQ
ncbi:MAG: hypothetical protein R3B13_20525 [Polyangiaceae bacterium]